MVVLWFQETHTGIAIIVLDALTKREWVPEEDLAADLKIPIKILRRVVRYLEQARVTAILPSFDCSSVVLCLKLLTCMHVCGPHGKV